MTWRRAKAACRKRSALSRAIFRSPLSWNLVIDEIQKMLVALEPGAWLSLSERSDRAVQNKSGTWHNFATSSGNTTGEMRVTSTRTSATSDDLK